LLNTVFRPNAVALNKHKVFDVAVKALEYFSKEFPGIPYPYPTMTVFNGDGGMEFPMMVNDDDTETWNSTVYLTSHEMSHTYFPFYTGINETKYGWMDEGWAVYLPQDFQTMMQKYVPDDEKSNNFRTDSREYNTQTFERTSGTLNDIPMLSPSNKTKNPSYRINAYNKAALVYDILKDMLGKEVFMNCLHEFMNRWKGKHPMPFDFFFTFNDVSKQNLNWFWKKWFFEYGAANLTIGEVKEFEGMLEVEIINKGGMPVPVNVTVTDTENSEKSFYYTAKIWEDGKDRVILRIDHKGKTGKINLGNKYIPDINKEDNSYNF
jgi:aminopeptidase N